MATAWTRFRSYIKEERKGELEGVEPPRKLQGVLGGAAPRGGLGGL